MSTGAPTSYSQLDAVTYLNMINNRIRELETQYAQLTLRISAPAPTDVITEQDRQNLSALKTSIDYLTGLAAQVQGQVNPLPAPASA